MRAMAFPTQKSIEQYCLSAAEDIGLEIDRLSWSVDFIDKYHALGISAKTGTTEVHLAQQEIDEYENGVGVSQVNSKIRAGLEGIT